jgi:hypothetical protein
VKNLKYLSISSVQEVYADLLSPSCEVLQVNAKLKKRLRNCKRRIQHRLRPKTWPAQQQPMFHAGNIYYDLADKTHGLACGGIGAFHLLADRLGVPDAINRELHLLQRHLPYFESDHVLNLDFRSSY